MSNAAYYLRTIAATNLSAATIYENTRLVDKLKTSYIYTLIVPPSISVAIHHQHMCG